MSKLSNELQIPKKLTKNQIIGSSETPTLSETIGQIKGDICTK